MKIIKRGNIAILSLTLMVMIAGYINYRYNPEREQDLGQTILVNNDTSYVYVSNDEKTNVYKETTKKNNDNLYKNKINDSISNIKSEREDMYSELEVTYKQVVESANTSEENIKIYQDKLDNIIKEKYKMNLIESLIKSKGIEDIVITKTDNKINIIVSTQKKITTAQVAIIQKIIQDEFQIDATNINLIEKQ